MAWRARIEYNNLLAQCCRLLCMPCNYNVCMSKFLCGAC